MTLPDLPPDATPFTRARWELAKRLELAGLTGVTLDPAALVPFVLVDAVTLTPPAQGIGSWPGTVPIKVVVPAPGDATALAALEAAATVILATLGFAATFPTTYELGDGNAVPCYELTFPIDVPNPNC